jgi:ABC-type nitrate/sulfonate/bicarbonate transport system permease component
MTRLRSSPWLFGVVGAVIFIAIWSIASAIGGDGYVRIPGPAAVVVRTGAIIDDGSLPAALLTSLRRIIVGFSLSAALGVAFGVIAGTAPRFGHAAVPVHAFLRYIPPTAFIPSLIYYFGIGEGLQYAVIFFSTYFFIFQMTVDAIAAVDVRYIEMAANAGLGPLTTYRFVYEPGIRADVIDLLRINFSGAWTFLIAGEIIGASTGMGRMIANAMRFGQIETVYAVMLAFGLIGFVSDAGFAVLKRYSCPWIREPGG